MKISTMALFFGGALVLGSSGLGLAACSSSSATGNPSNVDSGGHDGTTGDGGMTPDSAGDDGGGTGDAGGDAATCKTPPGLHPTMAGSIFCGYNDAGAFSCPTGQQCCLGGKVGTAFDPQICAPFGGNCDNPPPNKGTPIECGQASDCTANGKPAGTPCCLQMATVPAVDPGCPSTNLTSKNGTGIICEATDAGVADGGVGTCGAGELQICAQQADCPTGKTCTPTRWKLYQLGFCM